MCSLKENNNTVSSNEISYIYLLKDPVTEQIKYVGQSIDPYRRYKSHIKTARNFEESNYKSNWIKSLLKKNLEPILKVVKCVEINKIDNVEISFIFTMNHFFPGQLTNTHPGGSVAKEYYRTVNYKKFGYIKISKLAQGNIKINKPNISGYIGVTWSKNKQQYVTTINKNKKAILLCTLDDPKLSAYFYDCAALQMYGKHAKTNGIGTQPLSPTQLRREVLIEQKKKTSCPYLGVIKDGNTDNFIAMITIDGKQKEIGRFKNSLVAARIYDSVVNYSQIKPITNFNGVSSFSLEKARDICRKIFKRNSVSKYNGITVDKQNNFIVVFRYEGKQIEIGRTKDELKAARIADALVRTYTLTNRKLNFEGNEKLTIEEAKELLKIKQPRKSLHYGVMKTPNGKYSARVSLNHKTKSIGTFPTELEAALAVDSFILSENLNRPLNFPIGETK